MGCASRSRLAVRAWCHVRTPRSGPTTSTAIHPIDQPSDPDWGWFLAKRPEDLADLVRSGRSLQWVERLVRALDRRSLGALNLPPTDETDTTRSWLPPNVVPIVGALPAGGGALGALVFSAGPETLGTPAPPPEADGRSLGELERYVHRSIALVTDLMTELLPGSARPRARVDVEPTSSGDSAALAAGVGALLQLHGVAWPEDLVVTGGLAADGAGYAPVPEATLPGKIAALRQWGYRRLGVVAEQAAKLPSSIDGIELVALPSDPAELPAALAGIEGIDLSEEDIARGLVLFDLRVGRAGVRMSDRVLACSERYLEDPSPLVRHLAHDMRSRMLLHTGQSEAAAEALAGADRLRGVGHLPDGRLGDVLRYQQPAHRSVLHLDLGEWSDDHPAHRRVDELIDELDDRWNTRHERLMRFFLANTRARRLEHLGRLQERPELVERAWIDRERDRADWGDLIDGYAIGVLRLRDTTRARIRNEMIDVAASLVALGEPPSADRVAFLETLEAEMNREPPPSAPSPVLEFVGAGGRTSPVGGDGFDALARLRLHRALGRSGVPEACRPLLDSTTCRALGPLPHPWYVWYEELALLAQASGERLATPEVDPSTGCPIGWERLLVEPAGGILQILALRSAHVLRRLGLEPPEPRAPSEGTSLRTLFEDLLARPDRLVIRTPY